MSVECTRLIHESTLITPINVVNVDDMIGLEGVIVAETRLSHVDGEEGRLILAGRDVEEVVAHGSFEEACALLWEQKQIQTKLAEGRALAYERFSKIGDALEQPSAMDALRAAAAHLPGDRTTKEELTGALAVFTAAWIRRRAGEDPIAPDPQRTHAEDLLTMMRGAPPTAKEAKALAAYLSAVIDHGMNASTFAARVVASTESDLVSAIVAAIGALKGRLHGGAPGPVLDMLDAVGAESNAEPWIRAELAAGRRIMGMGHRIYRVRDPRAFVLERTLVDLAGDSPRVRLARTVEKTAEAQLAQRRPERRISANVEFYTALLLEALGVPREAFTAVFACGRVAGWCAHYAEERENGRLIRPSSKYVRS
jgi:citrate synthase